MVLTLHPAAVQPVGAPAGNPSLSLLLLGSQAPVLVLTDACVLSNRDHSPAVHKA